MKLIYIIILNFIIIINWKINLKKIFCTKKIENCWSCKNDKCMICDILEGYYYNKEKNNCIKCKFKIKNCYFSFSCNSCQVCYSGFTLCNGICIKLLDNCWEMKNCTNQCLKCNIKYKLYEGKCIEILNKIKNCLKYKNENDCDKCDIGFKLLKKNNISFCEEDLLLDTNFNTNTSKCFIKLGNLFSCNSCIYKEKNTYKFYKFKLLNPYEEFQEFVLNNYKKIDNLEYLINPSYTKYVLKKFILKKNVCYKNEIPNCKNTNNSLKCIECDENYYTLNGKCYKFLQSSVDKCIKYEAVYTSMPKNGYNQVICSKCKLGYYINDGVCNKFSKIRGCKVYNHFYNQCLECDELNGYKSDNNQFCTNIKKFLKVKNCALYYRHGEYEGKCGSCWLKYFLKDNKCITINNCKILFEFDNKLACKKCLNGFKLNYHNNKCDKIDKKYNCWQVDSQGFCILCKKSYFLVNSICTNEKNNKKYITNCEIGGRNWNCLKCKKDYIKVPTLYECRNYIIDCLYYNDNNGDCLLCDNGKMGNRCQYKGIIPYCKIYKFFKCVSCYNNLYLNLNTHSCVYKNINYSNDICSHNPIFGYKIDRTNSNNIFYNDNSPLILNNYCAKCLVDSFIPDTINKERCVPKISRNSNHPYKEDKCSTSDIKIYIEKKILLTCRSFTDIISANIYYDLGCYIYKNNLNDYLDFDIYENPKTLCSICYSGYRINKQIENLQCISIPHCLEDKNYFGGCNKCTESYKVSLSGDECDIQINNCLTVVNNHCIKCYPDYYGILENPTSFENTNIFGTILGHYGDALPINYRDSNNIKIPSYIWFFYSKNITKFRFKYCINSIVRYISADFSESIYYQKKEHSIGTLAVVEGSDYPYYCREGYYMKYFDLDYKLKYFGCQKIINDIKISNLPYNNFFRISFNFKCDNESNFLLLDTRVGGPFCYVHNSNQSIFDPLKLDFANIANCEIYSGSWDYNFSNLITNKKCLLCKEGYANNLECLPESNTNKILPCNRFIFDNYKNIYICALCPKNYVIINNSCVLSTQIYKISNNNNNRIIDFINNFNCDILSWDIYNPGITGNFIINSTTIIPNCLECKIGYIMEYETYNCIKPNKFNFKNCWVSHYDKGCLACMHGLMHFKADSEYHICIEKPIDIKFKTGSLDINCELFEIITNYYLCKKCKKNYYKLNDICTKNIIMNCEIQSDINTCDKCYDKFIYENNICIEGNIDNCLIYENKFKCIKCEKGYSLWNDKSYNFNYIKCINTKSISENFGNICSIVKSVNNSSNILYCFCDNGTIPLVRNPIINSFCLPNFINNCKAYDNNICLKCNNNNNLYILVNNQCILRKKIIEYCEKYIKDREGCEICKNGYYRNLDTYCIRNPTGKSNCMYPTINGCKVCIKNYFLKNRKCIKVELNNIISNCYRYDINQDCIICNKGFLIKNFKCYPLSLNTFIDPYNLCKFSKFYGYPKNKCKCLKNIYYFNNLTKKCEKIKNCLIANTNGTCKLCLINMYYNKKCVFVTYYIDNCLYYKSDGICEKCENKYALINNRCNQVPLDDRIDFCNNYISGSKCIVCNIGQELVNGKCKNLKNNNIFLPLNYNNMALICNTGTTMDVNRNCILNKKNFQYIYNFVILFILYSIK